MCVRLTHQFETMLGPKFASTPIAPLLAYVINFASNAQFCDSEIDMSVRCTSLLVAVCMASFSLTKPANAQYGPMGFGSKGLSAQGTETIELKAAKLRLVMWVEAQGADSKAAVQALAAHKARLKTELEKMKADTNTIEFSSLTVASSAGDPNQQRYMQMQMRNMRGGSTGKLEMPKVYKAKAALKVDWKLPEQEEGKSNDAIAMLPANLLEQIAKRDFAGAKNKAKLSSADQEKMDELEAMMEDEYGGYYGGGQDSKKPQIMFIGEVSEADLKAAIKTAYESAKSRARMLSEATGVQLGKLSSVTTSAGEDFDDSARYGYGGYAYGYGNSERIPAKFRTAGKRGIMAGSLDALKKSIVVVLVYDIN